VAQVVHRRAKGLYPVRIRTICIYVFYSIFLFCIGVGLKKFFGRQFGQKKGPDQN
jgi:Sec-independent protein secretion pathway component TatC